MQLQEQPQVVACSASAPPAKSSSVVSPGGSSAGASEKGAEDDEGSSARSLCATLNARTIFDPRTNTFVAYWDLVATLALFFTALVTPVEVAFLEPPKVEDRGTNALFITNRFIDGVFILDMLLQFRMVYKTDNAR